MEIGEYFFIQLSVWSTNFPPPKKGPDFFPDKVDMVRGGVRVGVRVRISV